MSSAATRPRKILIQTTIPYREDDWNIDRFSLLRDYIAGLSDEAGEPIASVDARDREPEHGGTDPFLAAIDQSDYDQVWLFGIDTGGNTGISVAECLALTNFRRRGGAIFSSRDHQDLGASICNLGGIGRAHYFHSTNLPPDPALRQRDDPYTKFIDWPNFHSGANGDVQRIGVVEPAHPVLGGDGAAAVRTLPAHPHEGLVGAPPDDPTARNVVTGTSEVTHRPFTIAVAFEESAAGGRGWAESTFHHFADYNWDVRMGCPSFVSEKPSDRIEKDPALLDDTKRYVRNLVNWLGRRPR